MNIDDIGTKFDSRLSAHFTAHNVLYADQVEEILSNAINAAYDEGVEGIDGGAKTEFETEMRTLLTTAGVLGHVIDGAVRIMHEAMEAVYENCSAED